MNWLKEAITTSSNHWVSSKRVVLLWAAFSLGIATLILATAACFGVDVALAIAATATPLAGLGSYSYVADKKNQKGEVDVGIDK